MVMMTRVLVSLSLLLVACDKPSEEACRDAVQNTRKLRGNDRTEVDVEAQVRRCRSGSTKKMVACVTAATTIAELEKCQAEVTK
jgi:hypothetical protein